MLVFAVLVARDPAAIAARTRTLLRDPVGRGLPFRAVRHVCWSNDHGTVWFAGWADGDDRPAAAGWHLADTGLTAFAGHLWPRLDGWAGSGPWVEQLAAHLRRSPLGRVPDDLTGVFAATSLASDGRSAITTDPLGISLLYRGDDRGVTVVASRAALAAALLGSVRDAAPEKDTVGTGWLAYSGFPMGDETGYRDIALVPPGAVLEIAADGAARLAAAAPPWRGPPVAVEDVDARLDVIQQEMTTTTRMARAGGGGATPQAGLTGGKDSRLILSLLVADGTAHEVEFHTNGNDDLPDVVVARELAQRFGVQHVVNPPRPELWRWRQDLEAAVRSAGYPDASDREIGLRVGAELGAGARNMGDGLSLGPPASGGMLISGLCGEALRSNYPGSARFRTKRDVAHLPDWMKLGGAGILHPDVQDRYRRRAHELLFEGCRATDSPQDVADAFYLRNRLRRWFGAEQETDHQSRVFPLYSITGIRLAFAIGAENRQTAWIHHHLMQRACPALVDLPFAASGWNPAAAGGLVPPLAHHDDAPDEPEPLPPTEVSRPTSEPPLRTVARDRRAAMREVDVTILRRFLCEDRGNPVEAIVDRAAARAAIDRFADLTEPQRMQVYGAATAAIWLGGHGMPVPG